MNTNTKQTALLIAFADAPYQHWAPRFADAFAGNVDRIAVPNVDDIGEGIVHNLPDEREGVALLVNARVAAALSAASRKAVEIDGVTYFVKSAVARNDIFCLPVGAPQDGTPVGLDFLVKVE